jgi:cytochrome c
MNSFELNKILGALLACVLITLSLNITAGALFSPVKPAKPGYDIAVKETAGDKAGPAAAEEPMEAMLASASVEKGQATAKQCGACHTFEKGGPNRVGPNLWGIIGRAKATEAGFNYSAAMKAKGGNWGFGDLYAFLANPRGVVPGTNMTFAGLARGQQRADVIDYLNTLSDSPQPMPKAAAAPAAAPAGGAAPPAAAAPAKAAAPAAPKH